jgi:hypothetical protein
MLTAETIRRCAYIDTITLEKLLRKSYPKDSVIRSEFLGITNGQQFAYKIVYPDEDANNGMAVGKVFVSIKDNALLVDY